MTRIHDDDDWVTAAMADDSAVAELLTLFRRHTPPQNNHFLSPPPPQNNHFLSPPPPPLEWTVRQPRSKSTTTRASPTTPLSWSAAAAASASGDASDESNRRPKPHRSTVTAASGINANKKSKKKRTINELKQEEMCLEYEREQLKKQLETFRFTLENQRAMNESLKRFKIAVLSQPPLERVQVCRSIKAIPNQMQLQNASFAHPSCSISTEDIRNEDCEALKRLPSKAENSSENFVLPDLNIPFDEHSNIELL